MQRSKYVGRNIIVHLQTYSWWATLAPHRLLTILAPLSLSCIFTHFYNEGKGRKIGKFRLSPLGSIKNPLFLRFNSARKFGLHEIIRLHLSRYFRYLLLVHLSLFGEKGAVFMTRRSDDRGCRRQDIICQAQAWWRLYNHVVKLLYCCRLTGLRNWNSTALRETRKCVFANRIYTHFIFFREYSN